MMACNIAGGPRSDYLRGPYFITIPAGVTTYSFSVIIREDDIIESNERFRLEITSLSNNVHSGSFRSTTVTIVDGQSKKLYKYIHS